MSLLVVCIRVRCHTEKAKRLFILENGRDERNVTTKLNTPISLSLKGQPYILSHKYRTKVSHLQED